MNFYKIKISPKNLFLIVILLFSVVSCSIPEKSVLPPGNINIDAPENKANTESNDVSPQNMLPYDQYHYYCEAIMREHQLANLGIFNQNAIIQPGSKFTRDLFPLRTTLNKDAYDYLTENVESINFVTKESGFASFAYPPSSNYNEQKQLPFFNDISDKNGGVDIYEFHYDKIENKYIFNNLGEKINSKFWDSNPMMVSDTVGSDCYKVLIWSSDRQSPFKYIEPLDGKKIFNLNKDIYYSFNRNDEGWNDPVKLEGGNVNTDANEVTPHIYCLCCNPILFFASNRHNKVSDNYDLYYTKLHIDYPSLKIFVTQDAKPIDTMRRNQYNVVGSINSSWDERFPFVPLTLSMQGSQNYIYFVSNRYDKFSKNKLKYKDSSGKFINVIENVGGYDIYRYNLPNNSDFDCYVPPPPVYNIFLKVSLNQVELKLRKDTIQVPLKLGSKNLKDTIVWVFDTISYQQHIPDYDYCLKSAAIRNKEQKVDFSKIPDCLTQKTEMIYQIEKSHQYEISTQALYGDCETGECTKVIITTPSNLLKDDTINVELNCLKKAQPESLAEPESYANGIAFFVTGYWWPTTSKNLALLRKRIDDGELDRSRFIDVTDYKPDSRDYYKAAAENNDKFLQNELFPKIESMLDRIDKCYKNQKVMITIHSFTDPCPLKIIRDETGQIIQDYTLYTADPEIVYNDIVITPGTKMKEYTLKKIDGSPFQSNLGSQQGNVVLAMLRSYYTKQTIIDGFTEYLRKKGKNIDWQELVDFKLDAFGIYDEANKNCPYPTIFYNIDNLPNEKYGSSDGIPYEPCNLPYSRRAMIYLDLINKGYEEYVVRNECGQLINNFYTKLSSEIKKESKANEDKRNVKIINEKDVKLIDFAETVESQIQNLPCAGNPCFWVIRYGIANSEQEYREMLKILQSMGITNIEITKLEDNKWALVSQKETNKNLLDKKLEDYKITVESKLKGLLKNFDLNAEIIAVQ